MTSQETLDLAPAGASDDVRERFRTACALLSGVAQALDGVFSDDLASLAADAAAAVAAAQAAQAAVVLEAAERGVIASSDHPRPRAWVEQSCRDAAVPVAKAQARWLHDVTTTCLGTDVAGLREAVTGGRVPVEAAAVVAATYRRLRTRTDYGNWDTLAEILVEWAASGAPKSDLETIEDLVLGQYGLPGELDRIHEHRRSRRDLTPFRQDRAGMLVARIRLDPASEAEFTAAIHALSAPRLDEHGIPDDRTAGQRRADALLTLAGLAQEARPEVPGTGAKARVVVTTRLTDLLSGLDAHGRRVREERGHALTRFGRALSPTEARIAACDAEIVPAVLGTDGEVLELGRSTRLVTPAQRRHLWLRDKGCTYPGCSAPPSWCDGHHIVHWARGGTTDPPNLALLCRHHHTEVHRHDHTATVDHSGVHWTRRDGTPIGLGSRRSTP